MYECAANAILRIGQNENENVQTSKYMKVDKYGKVAIC